MSDVSEFRRPFLIFSTPKTRPQGLCVLFLSGHSCLNITKIWVFFAVNSKSSSLQILRRRSFLSDSDFRCQIEIIFYTTLLGWELLLKWYNFFWNVCWNREFLLCATISTDC